MKNLEFLSRALTDQLWSVTPEVLKNQEALARADVLPARADAAAGPEAQVAPMALTQLVPLVRGNGKQVGIVTFHGVVISRCPDWATYYGYVSPQLFAAEIRRLADNPTVSSIVISVDSPGGTVAGTVEAAEAVVYARSRKKVTACVNDMACSAAYWVASQASEIVITPTAMTGSIGVIVTHVDYSKAMVDWGVVVTYIRSAVKKAMGQPYEPLTADARAEMQKTVDSIYEQFIAAVAKGRRKSRAVVAEQWASGEVWTGPSAVTAGLADRVASLSLVVQELTGAVAAPTPTPAPEPEPPLDDSEDDDPDARAGAPAAGGDPPEAADPPADPPPTPEAGSSLPPTPAPSAQEESPMKIEAILAKVQKGEKLTAEERAALDAHLDGNTPAAGTQPTPATALDLSQLSPEARAAVEKAQADATAANARAERAEQTANTERDTRLNREFRERALALGQPAAFGATLRAAHEKMSEDEYKALEQSLNATGAQLALIGETGSSQDQRQGGNVQAEYETRVQAAMKADPTLSRSKAGQQVMRADPGFAARYKNR